MRTHARVIANAECVPKDGGQDGVSWADLSKPCEVPLRLFIFALSAFAAVAAYAGDVANTRCDWTLSGYACEAGTIVASVEGGSSVRSKA